MSSTDNPFEHKLDLVEPAPEKPHHTSFGARVRNYFLTGLIVAGPLAITIYLTW